MLGVFAALALSVNVIKAQQTAGDVAKEATIIPGTTVTNGSVRVIDNKGTIKYLQVKNGLTLLSNITNDVTTTTWQLGGTLTDDTYIDVDGKVFALDGITIATQPASIDATSGTSHGGTNTATGFTLLVRDEATGAVQKLLAKDLILSGTETFTAAANQTTYTLAMGPDLEDFSKVWVYRNGAKLIAGVDYTVDTTTGAIVTLVPQTGANNNWSVFLGDIIEVQYIK